MVDCLSIGLSSWTAMSAPPISGRIDMRREWPRAFVSHRGAPMRSGQKENHEQAPRGQKFVQGTGWLGNAIRPRGAFRSDLSCRFELPLFAPPFWQCTEYSAAPGAALADGFQLS